MAFVFQLQLTISGRVQGVFFRAEAQKKAHELGLTGHVKNMPDGSVEVYAEGLKEELHTFIAWCQTGPELAKVEKIEEKWKEANERKYSEFVIR